MSRSQRPQDRFEFKPLTLPQVKPGSDIPSEPVNWFKVLAPRLDPPSTPAAVPAARAPGPPGTAQVVLFGDVDDFARQERERREGANARPKEVVEMLEAARRESARILAAAREEARRTQDAARTEGYAAGHIAGYADGERQATELLTVRADADRTAIRADMQELVQRIEAARARYWEELEPQVIALVLDVAKQVIKTEITATGDMALSVIRHALRRVSDDGSLRIRVNVEELPTVRSSRQQILDVLDGVRRIEIVEDRRVGPGGCVIDTEAGSIDARIDSQLGEVEDLFLSALPPRKAA